MANVKDKSTPYWNDMGVRANVMCSTYKSMDKNKNFDISNNIDQHYMLELWKGGCVYCGETDWHKLGCDRIDNSKPHSKDNVVCSCKDCNWVRNANFSFEEMLMIGETIRNIKKLRHQSQN